MSGVLGRAPWRRWLAGACSAAVVASAIPNVAAAHKGHETPRDTSSAEPWPAGARSDTAAEHTTFSASTSSALTPGSSASGASTEPANATCPVSPEEPVDPAIYTDHEGTRVWFCCRRCMRKFLKNPGAYVAGLPQFAATSNPTGGTADGETNGGHAGHVHPADAAAEAAPAPPALSRLDRAIRFAGKFHPLALHFPIALLIGALIAKVLGGATGEPRFEAASRVMVLMGAPGAAVTAALGWMDAAFITMPAEMAGVLTTHRWLGTTSGVLGLGLLVLSERSHRRRVHGKALPIVLAAVTLLVGVTAHFGATLIYGQDYYTW